MICPECKKAELQENINLKGWIFRKKVITTYCPICDFKKVKEFSLSKEDLEIEMLQRGNIEKKTKISYDTKKRIEEYKK